MEIKTLLGIGLKPMHVTSGKKFDCVLSVL
jgi:hypothetical protein